MNRRLAVAGVLVVLVVSVVAVVVPAGIGWDFANFYDAGRKAWVGQTEDLFDPMVDIAGEPPQAHMAFWALPLTSYLYAPLGAFDAPTALVLFKIQNVLALWAALWLLFRHLRPFAGPGFAPAFVWLALLFQPLWTIFRVGGQTTPTVFLLLVLGGIAHTRGRLGLSSLCFVAAVTIKPVFVVGLGFLALASGLRYVLWSAAWGIGAGLLSLALTGWTLHVTFVERMLAGAGKSIAWMHNSALTVPLENLRLLTDPLPTAPSRPLWIGLAILGVRLAVLAASVRLVREASRRGLNPRARRHFVYLVGILFSLWISPIVWEHYLTLLMLPLGYLLASWRRLDPRGRGLLVATFVASIGQNLILVLWLEHHFRFDHPLELIGIGLFKAAPLMLSFLLVWGHRDDLFRSYEAPAWR